MIRYIGKASYKDSLNADVRASALLGLLQYRYIYEDEDSSGLFLAGFRIKRHSEIARKQAEEDPDNRYGNDPDPEEEKGTSLIEKLRKFAGFVSDEDNLKVLRSVKNVLIKLVKHIFPRKITGNITFGLNDPYLTGKVLEIFAIIYAAAGNDLEVHPMWDETIIEGKITFCGHASVIYMLFQICRLRFNRECMKVWRKYHG